MRISGNNRTSYENSTNSSYIPTKKRRRKMLGDSNPTFSRSNSSSDNVCKRCKKSVKSFASCAKCASCFHPACGKIVRECCGAAINLNAVYSSDREENGGCNVFDFDLLSNLECTKDNFAILRLLVAEMHQSNKLLKEKILLLEREVTAKPQVEVMVDGVMDYMVNTTTELQGDVNQRLYSDLVKANTATVERSDLKHKQASVVSKNKGDYNLNIPSDNSKSKSGEIVVPRAARTVKRVALPTVKDDFEVVTSRKNVKLRNNVFKRPTIVGEKAHSSNDKAFFNAADQYKWLHLSKIEAGTTAERIINYISSVHNISDVKCFVLTNNDDVCTFKVGIRESSFDALLDPGSWSKGVLVRRFIALKKPSHSSERKRSGENFLGVLVENVAT
ncbi:hypothetical protein ABEB36_015450 [Hypothenemus hampei]|uniref:Uncharacterized protein n=1 Tax=Hypothenemus hampei TaxID=57062 RepID=A0ABD1E083_HYPHA